MKPAKPDLAKATQDKWQIPKTDLVKPKDNLTQSDGLDLAKLQAIMWSHAENYNDLAGIMQLLPDLRLVKEILIASILSPKDLADVQLNIKVAKEAPPEFAEIVRNHFSTVYDLNSQMATILGKALFEVGSHIVLTLSPAAIRNLIKENTSYESLNGDNLPLGELIQMPLLNTGELNLARSGQYAIEDFQYGDKDDKALTIGKIEVTDNPYVLLKPELVNASRHVRRVTRLKSMYGMEGRASLGSNIGDKVYLKSYVKYIEEVSLKNGDKEKEIFNPITITIPPEAFIVVHVPGDPSKRIGGYILTGEDGYPINMSLNANKFKELNNALTKHISNSADITAPPLGVTANTQNMTVQAEQTKVYERPMMDAYIKKIEEELKDAVEKGDYKGNVTVSAPEEIYRIMYARQLANQQTKLVYVPADMFTYFAFNYDSFGTGVSLLEQTKMYAAFRATLVFATVLAGIKGSINLRDLNISLDDDEKDPQGVIETILNTFVALQSSGMPLGNLNPADIFDSLQRAGIQVKLEGGKIFSSTTTSVTERKRDITPPDTSIMDMLKIAHYAGLGVNPELIDSSLSPDFAIGIASNNLMHSKRAMGWQKIYIDLLSDHMKQYILCGGPLYNDLKKAYDKLKSSIKNNLTLDDIIDSIEAVLPKADISITKAHLDAFKDYSDFIELAVENYVSEDMINGMLKGENIPGATSVVKEAIVSVLKRQYLTSQNMLPEISSILLDKDVAIAELINTHNTAIVEVITDIITVLKKVESEADKKIQAVADKLAPAQPTDETPTGDNTGDDTGNASSQSDDSTGDDTTTPATPDATEDTDKTAESDDTGDDDLTDEFK